jgi:hypothetical protein
MSQDIVAIESVLLDFFRSEGAVPAGTPDNYLHEAALANNPPSGTIYDPENDGIPLQSLGVHEHWNNSTDKQYSRNLGNGEGIELIKMLETTSTVIERSNDDIPKTFTLTNYPNPFNLQTTISFALSKSAVVSINIYDVNGQLIRNLVNEQYGAGFHNVIFDAANLASVVYFVNSKIQLTNKQLIFTNKIILMK